MARRPRPNIDEVRELLRERDEREPEEPEEPEPEPDEADDEERRGGG